ncbi:MAG TPA: signal peptide peptidase SppA [Salinivirgaceae bacterium]|nr:signal peptide peptidase SppA [Salinivirgaceae bacterium]HQA75975.1 signal peptide peptidase SppA [Salinivirgaceae bacterium]
MKSFFKYFFASLLAMVVALFLSIFIFVGAIASFMTFDKPKVATVKPNSTIVFELNRTIVDRTSDNPFENLSFGGLSSLSDNSTVGLNKILENLKKAKDDENIKGILLRPDLLSSGMATAEEIRNALIEFKKSGKFLISYADIYTQKAYYLASVSDKIYLNPEGVLQFSGLTGNVMFYKRTLEKLGVEPQVIRHGRFKSAVEPFIQDKISPENRLQIETYLGSIWTHMLTGIGQVRSIEVSVLQDYANQFAIINPEDAVNNKMIDGVRYYDEVCDEIKTLTGTDSTGDFNSISLYKYTNAPGKKSDKLITDQSKIAVIYAQGEIGTDKGNNAEIGVENISNALAEARKDKSVKAVVLRINSPGGSALTSEIILREAKLTQKEKPLIVSMGNVAASGGYYIACAADTIVANPNTITGSIGVFGIMFNAEKLLNTKLGITVNTIKTAQYADMGSPMRKMTQAEEQIIRQQVVKIYKTFVGHVSEARKMSFDEVDKIGEGRVWTGIDAKNVGLVDVFGGLSDAVRIAAEKAQIEDYRVIELPKLKDPFKFLLEELETEAVTRISGDKIIAAKYLEHITSALKMNGIQARMEYDLDIN